MRDRNAAPVAGADRGKLVATARDAVDGNILAVGNAVSGQMNRRSNSGQIVVK